MSRRPLHSPSEIRAAVDALLSDAGLHPPLSADQFRRAVSVRRLRAWLGGGDHATLGRSLRELEQQYVEGSRRQRPLPSLPDDVASLMERVWAAAVTSSEAGVMSVREEAARSVADAQAARENADVRVSLLRQELDDLRTTLAAHNQTIGELRALLAASEREATSSRLCADELAAQLKTAGKERAAECEQLQAEAARVREEYEGLRASLLTSTDAQRQELVQRLSEQGRHLRHTEQLLDEVTRDRDRLRNERHGWSLPGPSSTV